MSRVGAVLPGVPLRQFVLTMPFPLRFPLVSRKASLEFLQKIAGGSPGPRGDRGGAHWQRASLVHRGSASSAGRGGEGIEPGRAEEVLPDREARNDLGVVSADGGAEVQQLGKQGRSTAEKEGHSEAGGRDGAGELGWGYTKIRDALRTGLKIEIGRTTVANILLEEGIEPAPEREKKRTWKRFMKSHWDTLCACDFFSVEALGHSGRSATWCSSSSRSRAAPSRSPG